MLKPRTLYLNLKSETANYNIKTKITFSILFPEKSLCEQYIENPKSALNVSFPYMTLSLASYKIPFGLQLHRCIHKSVKVLNSVPHIR